MTAPVTPPPSPPPPSQNIGPFYQAVGAFGLVASIAVVALIIWRGQVVTLPVLGIAALPFVLSVLLARPPLLDALIRKVATKLPFTKYGDPDADR